MIADAALAKITTIAVFWSEEYEGWLIEGRDKAGRVVGEQEYADSKLDAKKLAGKIADRVEIVMKRRPEITVGTKKEGVV